MRPLLAAILFLGIAACAHDHALNRGEVGAMKNDSPVTSPWYGPDADPVAGDAPMAPIVDRVREMAVQVFATGGGEDVNVAARLASVAAAGELVTSEAAYAAAGIDRPAESREVTLKGVTQPVRVRVMRAD